MSSATYPSQEAARESWISFMHGNAKISSLRPEILRAWMRCSGHISPYVTVAPQISGSELAERLAAAKSLLEVGTPAIDSLYQFVEGSGFMVTLSDDSGCFIYVVGDSATIAASNNNVRVGSVWSEESVGANSIGTAIVEDSPIQFFGYEHYCKISQRWAGSAAPIHDRNGKVLGTVGISGELKNVHLHTLGMVVATARSIEVQLALMETTTQVAINNQRQRAIIDSISEGLLVIGPDNCITMINSALASLLMTRPASLLGKNISTLVPDPNLLEKIMVRKEFTDYISKLSSQGTNVSCTITARRVSSPDGASELVLIANEIVRAKKLAQRFQSGDAHLRFSDIIGEDIKLRSAVEIAMTAAETSANVLILGESGVGKDIFAQAIHNGSSRRNGPFVAVNCGAIPRELVASTLFGYEEGAFTGARRGGSPGKFELADGGTIFLDEIGELPLDVQTVLLRVLENKSFTRIGGTSSTTVDVHVIAATNRNLAHEVQSLRFRQDLYYRLNVISIHIPALRDRPSDIIPLSEYFLTQMNQRYQRNISAISPAAQDMLQSYSWPGNIRELQNVIERAVVLTKDDKITPAVLVALTTNNKHAAPEAQLSVQTTPYSDSNESAELIRILDSCHWNISKAAAQMGIARSTLYRKLDRLRIKEP